jgi:catechol 2,3-dioxygenase-like lactoylglutathione lyase family enzyme
MRRLHVNLTVRNIAESVRFYSARFAAESSKATTIDQSCGTPVKTVSACCS